VDTAGKGQLLSAGTSTVGLHEARPVPAVAPRDPPRSAVACRSANPEGGGYVAGGGKLDRVPVPAYVEDELRGYFACGLLCFGFARAVCMTCPTGFVVAFSCKGRGVCPSCNGRHRAQTAAHLVDHVIPPVPARQWVISVIRGEPVGGS
jgi:hypothetical protein